jgi:hypothetical protein
MEAPPIVVPHPVVIITPADPRDYDACLAAVKAGTRCTLAVGVTDRADYATQTLPGIAPGVYDCWLDGVPKMKRRETQPILPRLFNPPIVPVLGGS